MSAVMESSELKSPLRKLVRFFRRSRDGWKVKHHAMKRMCRTLANQVAAVEKSRDEWRARARGSQRRVDELEKELAEQKAGLLTRL
jgi:hypothetical protein